MTWQNCGATLPTVPHHFTLLTQVDLALNPERRECMLQGSGGIKTLPQLHVGGKYIGDCAVVQVGDRGGTGGEGGASGAAGVCPSLWLLHRTGNARQSYELASLVLTFPLASPAGPQELIDSDELNAILGITK